MAALISAYPEGLKSKDKEGMVPLHYAVRVTCPDVDIIMQLIDGCSMAAGIKDSQNELPIHYALRGGLPVAVLHRLLDAWPDGLKTADVEGDLPIHRGLENRSVPDEILIRIIQMYPAGCQRKNKRGDLPLHDAIYQCKSLVVIEALTTVYADAVIMKDKEGMDPIHIVLDKYTNRYTKEQKAKIALLFMLANANAAAAHDRAEGLAPLHLIVQDRGYDPFHVTEQVLAAHPECAAFRCRQGDLAIHFSVLTAAPLSVVAALVAAYPDGLKTKDKNRDTPLHYAVRNQISVDVIMHLIDGCPQAAGIQDDHKMLPIHHALTQGVSAQVLNRLLDVCLESLQVADRDNAIPLHHGLENSSTPEDVIIRMVQMYPEGCRKKNRLLYLPLHDCLFNGKSMRVIDALADVYPDAITMKDKEGVDPIHVVLDKRSRSCRYTKEQLAHVALLFFRLNAQAGAAHDREEGLCALHLIVQDFDVYQVTEQVLVAHPECASFKCRKGELPIHLAVLTQAPLSVLAALIAAYPAGLQSKDKDGSVPLHCALKKGNSTESVLQLIDGCSMAAGIPDYDRELPLHQALRFGGGAQVLHRLLDAWPDG